MLLAAYGEIDVPAGVTVVNAGDFLAHEQFLYLKNEMQRPVVHLADTQHSLCYERDCLYLAT